MQNMREKLQSAVTDLVENVVEPETTWRDETGRFIPKPLEARLTEALVEMVAVERRSWLRNQVN
jgi:hypothetical protein